MSLIRQSNGAIGQGPLYGADVIPNAVDYNTATEVSAAAVLFWQRDEIRGWDEKGERIGTGIPRIRPNGGGRNGFDWLFAKADATTKRHHND
jgi:predicted chitinase